MSYDKEIKELKNKRENIQILFMIYAMVIIILSPMFNVSYLGWNQVIWIIGLPFLGYVWFMLQCDSELHILYKWSIADRKHKRKITPGIRIDEAVDDIERSGL